MVIPATQRVRNGGSGGASQLQEGAIPVRTEHRWSEVRRNKPVPRGRSDRGNLGRNLRESRKAIDHANIPISNSFRRLGGDLGIPAMEEDIRLLEANKEKNNTLNQINLVKSVPQGNTLVFGARWRKR
ncbi:unnamed protein product [Arabis nemorensis]|uniref:Uncharacterized protein n=1 Tax=Arabis nemorensis TaxID=586526 RepID=A0A565BQY5_9BRAS|nr:unnamed protein product [Arabis nemorensis]